MNQSLLHYAEELRTRRRHRRVSKTIPARIAVRLTSVRRAAAVLWDIYGTLIALSVGDLAKTLEKKQTLLRAFRLTAEEFGFNNYLDNDPARILLDWYVMQIEGTHRRKRAHGVSLPEVKIEQIWLRILKQLAKRGYSPPGNGRNIDRDLAYRVAYFFDDAFQAKTFYPGARRTLGEIKRLGLRQGIISNAQFYTPLTLRLLLHEKGTDGPDLFETLFDKQIVFFSYRLGVAKPHPRPFEAARARLQKWGVEPSRVLYVGNDVRNDMLPAQNVGFRSVLFAGDRETLALRKEDMACAGFRPDAVIKELPQILKIIT
jgi:putative hydrolase of the HAD superfamily